MRKIKLLIDKYGTLAAIIAIVAGLAYGAYLYKNPPAAPAASYASPAPAPTPREAEKLARPLEGEVISGHSPEKCEYVPALGAYSAHSGIDISAEAGANVAAAASGYVLEAGYSPLVGWRVTIGHADFTAIYAGLKKDSLAEIGKRVAKGEIIGSVGESAGCEQYLGPHLHFEILRNGESLDPESFSYQTIP